MSLRDHIGEAKDPRSIHGELVRGPLTSPAECVSPRLH